MRDFALASILTGTTSDHVRGGVLDIAARHYAHATATLEDTPSLRGEVGVR
jgi:hypothetical protein